MMSFNNCEEIVTLLVETYDTPIQDNILFRNEVVHLDGYYPDVNAGSIIITSSKYEGVIFIIGIQNYNDNFLLSIIKNGSIIDQTYGVYLPMYYREEFIEYLR